MHLDLFNIDEFCDSLQPITEPKIFSKNSSLYTTGGLFSQTIFGPVRTATCSCPGHVYWGRDRIGESCPTCGVDITYASERRKRFAKIELPFPVFNPIMYHLLVKAGKNRLRDIIDKMLDDPKNGYYFDEKKKSFVPADNIEESEDDDSDDIAILYGIEGLYEIVEVYCELFKEENDLWEFISDNLDKFYISNIIVIPPEFRPVSRDEQKKDEINDIYLLILNFSLTLQDDNLGTDTLVGIKHTTFKYLQTHVFSLYEYIFSKLSKKRGLIRGSILGRRVDFSGRAVISPDPSLKLGECSLPYLMVLEIWKLDIANVLIEQRRFNRYDAAIDFIDECIELENYELFDITEKVLEDEYIVLNRQPTLHRLGELAFRPKVNRGFTIKIHPFVCGPYNADFDGDMMAVYRPLYPNCRQELKEKMSIQANLLCQTTGGMTLSVNQDVLLGLYMLTKEDETPKIELEDGTSTFEGRVLFNKCLPDMPVFFNKTVTKKLLNVIFNELLHGFEPDVVVETMDKIKDVGLRHTTMIGTTMSLQDLGGFDASELTDPIFDSDEDTSKKLAKLQSPEIVDKVKESFPYSTFIDSGSRGSWDQANQIIVARGFVSNFKGQVIPLPIRNNLMTGLTRREFLASCYGARKGLLDVAINTSVSGHLNRKMVYCNSNLELDVTNEDCGTEARLRIEVPAKGEDPAIDSLSLAGSMCGRWAIFEGESDEFLIDYSNYHTVIGRTVLLRSPIYCETFNLCKKCYGTHGEKVHSKYVGIIAGQALGEVSTQLVMRTFHTAGAVTQVTDSEETQDIVNDLALAKKLLHNSTPIEYRGRQIKKLTHNDILIHLFEIYSRHKRILLVHYECILSQMMRVGDTRWRLTESRDISECEIVSIESVPARESWLLALAFSKPRQYLIDGVLSNQVNNAGLLEKIMMNESF